MQDGHAFWMVMPYPMFFKFRSVLLPYILIVLWVGVWVHDLSNNGSPAFAARCIFLGKFLCLAGGALFTLAFFFLKKQRKAEEIPVSPIRLVRGGQVGIAGCAQSLRSLRAPFSNEPCVYYSYGIETYRPWYSGSSGWSVIDWGDSSDTPFMVRDSSGAAKILPKGAEFFNLSVAHQFATKAFGGNNVPAQAYEFVEKRSKAKRFWPWSTKRLRFTEKIIREGTRLFVIGAAERSEERLLKASGMEFELGPLADIVVSSEKSSSLIITVGNKEELTNNLAWHRLCLLISGPLVSALGAFLLCRYL